MLLAILDKEGNVKAHYRYDQEPRSGYEIGELFNDFIGRAEEEYEDLDFSIDKDRAGDYDVEHRCKSVYTLRIRKAKLECGEVVEDDLDLELFYKMLDVIIKNVTRFRELTKSVNVEHFLRVLPRYSYEFTEILREEFKVYTQLGVEEFITTFREVQEHDEKLVYPLVYAFNYR